MMMMRRRLLRRLLPWCVAMRVVAVLLGAEAPIPIGWAVPMHEMLRDDVPVEDGGNGASRRKLLHAAERTVLRARLVVQLELVHGGVEVGLDHQDADQDADQ